MSSHNALAWDSFHPVEAAITGGTLFVLPGQNTVTSIGLVNDFTGGAGGLFIGGLFAGGLFAGGLFTGGLLTGGLLTGGLLTGGLLLEDCSPEDC